MKEKLQNAVPQGGEIERRFESLTKKEKFETILQLFGSNAARNAFIDICKKYAALRGESRLELHGENYVAVGRDTHSPPQRANLHNQIMDTLKRLSLQKLDPLSERVIREMAGRETAGQIIKDWVLAQDEGEEEEELERRKREDDMSGPAYFHSLGKEH